jgi:type 1 fimbria pilin
MKKLSVAVVAAIAALGIATSSASAATATGTVAFRGSIVTSSCTANLAGTTNSPTSVTVTSGTFSSCSVGSVALAFSPAWNLTLSGSTFSITNVQAALTAPIVGTCGYSGGLTGTVSGSTLTITANTLRRVSGGSLCTTAPTVTGSLALTL